MERGVVCASEGDVRYHRQVGAGRGNQVMFTAAEGAADEEVVYGGGT